MGMADSNFTLLFSASLKKLPDYTRTMRKRIWLPCIIILAVCVMLLFMTRQRHATVVSEQNGTLTNLQSQVPEAPTANNQQIPSSPMAAKSFVSNAVVAATALTESNSIDPRILAAWQVPIDFYGKVVDENTNPVAGVNIHFRWSERPAEDGMKTADTQSDSDGLFSLHGENGRSLTVWYSKDGYHSSHNGQQTFLYALGQDIYSPDPQNPVIFYLNRKTKAASLISVKQNYRIPRDGTPVAIDLTTGKDTTGGTGNLVVQCWTEDQGKSSGQKYDWHCLVTIPGGGLVLSDNEFDFQAPDNGYVSSAEIKMPADRQDWQDDVDLKFFYQLPNGNYGRMTFSMIAGGHHFCMINSVLNPSGSPNLEPAQ
jgi:hypothetical protein